ncbi:hypothetical protein [Haloferula sp. BvORR071]|uniref:hypothetical protein n=1 Tax=Haloferula sp. BvORR071 TaxID=1396141 RepID=UPI0005541131|nr:hypothetical protein [Haloferula sp. BvORR071]
MFKQGEVVLGGRYRIEGPAGEKKSCVVFKGTRVSDDLPVAVRMLAPFVKKQPHVVARLRSRAEFVRGLEHPNLVPVLDVREDLDAFLVVETWYEALPLLRVVRGKGACSPYETAWIAGQLARGVDHLISSEAPGFDFTLSDVYADIGDLRRENEFFSMSLDRWPGLAVRLSPLALDGDGFSERALATPTDSAQPLVRSMARIVFNLVTGGMGDPLTEPVLSEKFTASLRDCLTGARQSGTCRELLWTLFGDFGPEITALLPAEQAEIGDAEVGSLLENLDKQGEELEGLLRYKTFGKQIKKQLAVLEEQRAGVLEQQRKIREDAERMRALEDRLQGEQRQVEAQRADLTRRGDELSELERKADEAAKARAEELRQREGELAALHAEQEREAERVRSELERLNVSQAGLASEKEALAERVTRYEQEQQELSNSRNAIDTERRKLAGEREQFESRSGELRGLKSDLERSRSELEEQQQSLARRQAELEARGAGISESERLILEQKELEARLETLQSKGRSLDEREAALRTKELSMESANRALAREEETLAGRMGEVDTKLSLERSRLADKEREVQSREETLAAKERDWQAKQELQRSAHDEKESLVAELRKKLDGVTAELGNVTAEKQRLESDQQRLQVSQQSLGQRSDSLDRERTDLKALEDKLRKEIQDEGENRAREHRALERRIVLYRRFTRFGVPAAAAVIIGLGALVVAKPKFPENASAVHSMPEWKQEWLRRDLAEDIGKKVAASEWREALAQLHYYSQGFSRRPDDIMNAAKQTSAELAKEYDAAPDKFPTTYQDRDGHTVPLLHALQALASWGIPDAERLYHHLHARESLRLALTERALGARADALRSIVELRRLYPDVQSWHAAVASTLMPLIASSIGEAMKLLEPGSSGQELTKEFREVFSSDQVIKDLKVLEETGIKEAMALRVAAEAMGEMMKSGTPDNAALANFIAARLAEDWPVEIRTKLIAVMMDHIKHFRGQLRKDGMSFVDALESIQEKPQEEIAVAQALWKHQKDDYIPDWFSKEQRRELYGFIGDVLTKHANRNPDVHDAYQFAANEGDEEGMYWSGRGKIGVALAPNNGNANGPVMVVQRQKDFDDGRYLLEEAAKSEDPHVRQEAYWVLAETDLLLGKNALAVDEARKAHEAGKNMKSMNLLMRALRAAQDPAGAAEQMALALQASKSAREAPKDPQSLPLLNEALGGLAELFKAGAKPDAALVDELTQQFKITPAEDKMTAMRFAFRANWKYSGFPPFTGLSEDERTKGFFEDLWEASRANDEAARKSAEANGLNWQKDKETAIREVLGR